jgi:hypothetical protein
MTSQNEVLSFAREYINRPASRTPERKAKIRELLFLTTGEKVVISCGTCYIEALYKILKTTKMAKYELKRGYVAQFPSDASRCFTNKNLLEDPAKYEPLAEEYLKLFPERIVFFTKTPDGQRVPTLQKRFVPPSNIVPPDDIKLPDEKQIKLDALKKSLRVNKEDLVERAKTESLPVEEWGNMNKPDLVAYLFEKLASKLG